VVKLNLNQIDGDDLVDSPLWQDFMGGLHRLLFRLADATAQTGAAGDNHHYEILVEVRHACLCFLQRFGPFGA
jgi:hypothetical protein